MQQALLHLHENYEALLCYALMHLATTLCIRYQITVKLPTSLLVRVSCVSYFFYRFWMWTCTTLKTRLQTCWSMTAA